MKNLWLFPQYPGDDNGYSIVVKQDIESLPIDKDNDIVIFYSTKEIEGLGFDPIVIFRSKKLSVSTMLKMLRLTIISEVGFSKLKFLIKYRDEIGSIYLGDVIFYDSIRKIFPDRKLTVKFHNFFSRIVSRMDIEKSKSTLTYKYNLYTLSRLERRILHDSKVYPIFISNEDGGYYGNLLNRKYGVDLIKINTPQSSVKHNAIKKIIWFGGVEAHKEDSIRWFIEDVYVNLKKKFNFLQFELYGKNTQKFSDSSIDIKGFGFYKEEIFPSLNNSLYINPDLTGGGVKIKIKSYLENNVRFISTPYGFEGYDSDYLHEYSYVVEKEEWLAFIIEKIEQSVAENA